MAVQAAVLGRQKLRQAFVKAKPPNAQTLCTLDVRARTSHRPSHRPVWHIKCLVTFGWEPDTCATSSLRDTSLRIATKRETK